MYAILRQLLFSLEAETSHRLSLASLDLLSACRVLKHLAPAVAPCPVRVMGLDFPNPVGLAAGLDKNADHFNALGELGFGFIEVGTVTPQPQPGNPRPRLFRLPAHQAIINRMGFNNKGVDHLVDRVTARRYPGILGINIGKNATTPLENAMDDYRQGLHKVYPLADYIAVNISSPNTPGLRSLQYGEQLQELLTAIKTEQLALQAKHGHYVPIAIKIAPDMDEEEVRQVARVLVETGMDGVIATNTTLERESVSGHPHAGEAGGLSGAPLRNLSTRVIAQLHGELNGRLPIIGVGGITDEESAREKIEAGASLIQLYSGFIYRGPGLISEAADAVAPLCRSESGTD